MKIKKILAAIATAAMALSVAACSSSTDSNGSSAADSSAADTSADKVYSIGICQLVQHEALDAATKGFKDVLTEKLGDKVKFDPQNANG